MPTPPTLSARSSPHLDWLAQPVLAPRPKGPQATHRELTPDDLRYGIDRVYTSPRRAGRGRVARAPKLETIFEERKLRTKRCELLDPAPNSTLKFSASYCPRAFGPSHFPGLPFVAQEEHLEHFAVLARWTTFYINVTRTFPREHMDGVQVYALRLYREAFRRGELR